MASFPRYLYKYGCKGQLIGLTNICVNIGYLPYSILMDIAMAALAVFGLFVCIKSTLFILQDSQQLSSLVMLVNCYQVFLTFFILMFMNCNILILWNWPLRVNCCNDMVEIDNPLSAMIWWR